MLAKHLPLQRAAAAALALHNHSKHPLSRSFSTEAASWRTEDSLKVAEGVLKHRLVREDPLAALSQPLTSGTSRSLSARHHLLQMMYPEPAELVLGKRRTSTGAILQPIAALEITCVVSPDKLSGF